MRITDLTTVELDALLEDNNVDVEAFNVFIEDVAGTHYVWDSVDSMLDAFEDSFAGAGNLPDYAYDYAKDCLGLEGTALDYFDADKFARDLQLGGDMLEARGYLFYGSW
jgi:hypothetical protein